MRELSVAEHRFLAVLAGDRHGQRFSQQARHDSEIPRSRAICAIDASPLRATAMT
jgi:hypothetical protein